jgi:hypothetical protein
MSKQLVCTDVDVIPQRKSKTVVILHWGRHFGVHMPSFIPVNGSEAG